MDVKNQRRRHRTLQQPRLHRRLPRPGPRQKIERRAASPGFASWRAWREIGFPADPSALKSNPNSLHFCLISPKKCSKTLEIDSFPLDSRAKTVPQTHNSATSTDPELL